VSQVYERTLKENLTSDQTNFPLLFRMSQVSSAADATNDNEVQISSGSEDSEAEARTEQPTNETPSGEGSSQGVNKRKRTSEIWKHFKDAEEGFI
jgi:hypothetical protein